MKRRAWWEGWRGGAWLVLLCLALFLPGVAGIPAVDRDESRFAQASRQMMASEDAAGWLVPKIQDRPRLNKPPLIYWLQAGSAAVWTGRWRVSGEEAAAADAIWMYRLPSVVAAIVAVLATWRIGVSMFHPAAAWLGAALLAAAPVMIWESKQARADMALLAFTTLAMWGLWELWSGRGRTWLAAAAFWVAMAAAVMTKGPIAPMVAGLCAVWLSVTRGGRGWLGGGRAVAGLLVLGAVVGAWVWGVANEVGFAEYRRIVFDETIGRSLESKEGHGGPPGYHFVAMHLLLGPGVVGVGLGFWRALRGSGARTGSGLRGWITWARGRLGAMRRADAFLLGWVVPSWVVFEAVSTKLPHYTLPLYPALALLAGRGIVATVTSARWITAARARVFDLASLAAVGACIGAVAAAGFGAAVVLMRSGAEAGRWIAPVIAGAIVFGVAGRLIAAHRRHRPFDVAVGGLIAMLITSSLVGITLSSLEEIQTSSKIAAVVGGDGAEGSRRLPIGAVGYHEDSLIFETRGRAERVADADIEAWVASHPGAVMAIESSRLGRVPGLEVIDTVRGFNYSKGRRVEVVVVRVPERSTGP